VSGQAGTLSFRWTLVLGSGIGVAEQFVGREPSGVTMLVAHRGGPTFAREQGSSCWRALRSSDRQALDNLGLPFPDQPAMRVRAPRVTRTGWLLPVVVDGDAGTFAVERSSAQVRTITIGVGHPILERVTALRSAPRLPPAEPRC